MIEFNEEGRSINWIKNKTSLPRSTLDSIIKRKFKVRQQLDERKYVKVIKRVRGVSHPILDKALFFWFLNHLQQNKPLSQNLLRTIIANSNRVKAQ